MTREILKNRLDDLASRHLQRKMRIVKGPSSPAVLTGDGEKLNFCSNDYLGLANNIQIRQAMAEAAHRWGASPASSRLVSGNTSAHEELQRELADFLGTEAAIVFPSGYQANVGAVTALSRPGDVIFSDALVHASIVDGCRLSRAQVRIYRHGDMEHLGQLLESHSEAPLKLIVTEGVFSMDGDESPLAAICSLAATHGALVYVDEAHSLGIMGPKGRGLTAKLGLDEQVAVRVGTFGKAFGTAGAFVATSRVAVDLICSSARSLLYTTAAPAPLIEATRVGLLLVRDAAEKREMLEKNVTFWRARARERGINISDSKTPIQPVVVGSNSDVMAVSEALWQRGLFVQGIRPPTVPEGTSRLRITLTAEHTTDQIDFLIQGLAGVL